MLIRRHFRLPAIILVIGLVASLAAAGEFAQAGEARDRLRFESAAASAVAAVEVKMETQIALLRGAAGLFAASDEVSGSEFHAYVERLRLETLYPGVLGIGYAQFLPDDAARARAVETKRRNGLRDFRLWPTDEGPVRSAILYLEPLNRRNQAALGFDMTSEPTRRAAMARARDDAAPAMSGKVLLVQEIDRVKQPGFLIYLPVYANGAPDAFAPAPARRLLGWVYSPLRAVDLLRAVFPVRADREIELAIYDGAPAPESLLFATAPQRDDPRFDKAVTLPIAGRDWTIRVASAESFETRSRYTIPIATALAGILLTILLAALAVIQGRAAALLEARVAERTGELTAANEAMRAEAQSREAAEAQVRQMQKMEAVGQLTGGIAHDFNNMLAIIVGSLQLARRKLASDPDRATAYIAHAEEGAERAASLTQRLLAFARRQPLVARPVDLNALMAGMIELLSRTIGEQIRVETDFAPDLWPVCADASQIENAVLNLAVNARDAMPDGGRLRIATANRIVAEGDPEATGTRPGDYVALSLADDGAGMPPDVVEHAFEPFFTTKQVGKGSGLGLSQVYGFVKQSGGYVAIDSEVGRGTTVTMLLPRWRGEIAVEPAANDEAAPAPGVRSARILVVEDEERVRRISVDALVELGYEVEEAADGHQAIAAIENSPPFDLLFTDIVMPGMNGRELAERVRTIAPDTKLLFTTGYERAAAEIAGARPGADVLSKPFTLSQLADRVEAALANP